MFEVAFSYLVKKKVAPFTGGGLTVAAF